DDPARQRHQRWRPPRPYRLAAGAGRRWRRDPARRPGAEISDRDADEQPAPGHAGQGRRSRREIRRCHRRAVARAARGRVAVKTPEVEMRWKTVVGGIASLFAVVTLAQAADQAPLVRAARSSDLVALRALLQRHADVNQADLDGTTALHW